MKKFVIFVVYICSLLFFVSCIDELGNVDTPVDDIFESVDTESVIIKATINDDVDSKTSISDDTGAVGSRVNIYWSKNDYIAVKVDGKSYNFAFKGYDDDRTSANFECSSKLPELSENMVLTAEYPSSGKPDLSKQYGTLESLSKYHHMIAEYVAEGENPVWEDVSFTFRTQTPIMKIILKNDAFKGQRVNDLKFSIDNKVIVTSTTNYTGTEDTGEITAYFVIDPQEIDGNTSITAVCGGVTYEAAVGASTMLTGGKLYRINKVMDKADVIMTYENDKAVITVFDGAPADAVIDKFKEAISDDYSLFELKGTLTDEIKQEVNDHLTDHPANTVLTIERISTFYVYDGEGFMNWGAAAENDRRSNCTLINDVDLTEDWIYCIGTYSTNYSGTLEGNGHSISGLSINQDALRLEYFNPEAMINYLSGEIRNLVIRGGKCVSTNSDISRSALLVANNSGIIDGITIGKNIDDEYVSFSNSNSQNSFHIGVIVCSNTNVVKNCRNKLPVRISIPEDADLYAGGITASNNNYIIQCINDGDIEVKGGSDIYIGGISGSCNDIKWHKTNIFLCANRADIEGGIIGYNISSGKLAGNYTTSGKLIYSAFYTPTIDHCYTTDINYNNNKYYVSNANLVCDEMNAAVESYECEYVDKEWRTGDGGCPNLRYK